MFSGQLVPGIVPSPLRKNLRSVRIPERHPMFLLGAAHCVYATRAGQEGLSLQFQSPGSGSNVSGADGGQRKSDTLDDSQQYPVTRSLAKGCEQQENREAHPHQPGDKGEGVAENGSPGQ